VYQKWLPGFVVLLVYLLNFLKGKIDFWSVQATPIQDLAQMSFFLKALKNRLLERPGNAHPGSGPNVFLFKRSLKEKIDFSSVPATPIQDLAQMSFFSKAF